METSIGHGWAQGPRNSPTVLNAVFNLAQFWDGRAKDLQEQAKGPVQAAVEMWEQLLTGLEKDPLSLRRECDWVAKYHLIEEYRARLPVSAARSLSADRVS